MRLEAGARLIAAFDGYDSGLCLGDDSEHGLRREFDSEPGFDFDLAEVHDGGSLDS